VVSLITEVSRDGRRRRCDARCYNARKPTCRCICGGRNHGVGLQKAMEKIKETVDDIDLALIMGKDSPLFPKEGGEK